jgi:hypothetical protein
MERYPDIASDSLWDMAETFNKLIQNSHKFRTFNYPEDKILDEKQEVMLKEIGSNLNPETISIQGFEEYYRKHYLS